jgi:hypothetical protein
MEILITGLAVYSVMLLTSKHKLDFSRGIISLMILLLTISQYVQAKMNSHELIKNTQYIIFFLGLLLLVELYRNFERKK